MHNSETQIMTHHRSTGGEQQHKSLRMGSMRPDDREGFKRIYDPIKPKKF